MSATSVVEPARNSAMVRKVPITVARGDGIGPEIMESALFLLSEAGAAIEPEEIQIGEQVYRRGFSSGIEPSSWHSLRRTRVFLKSPITTPQGGGVKSLNVTIRKTLGLYANVRPCRSYHPFIPTFHPDMDLVIVRENEEDLYAGIEHRQTDEVYQCLKLMSRPGCEKIIRYAFEYARRRSRRHLTCMTKDNIMKLTDGLFHKVFDEVARDYLDVQTEHLIVDIGMARVANNPERFDVIVIPNLYGDILSDIAAELTGSVGLAGSANIGDHVAMFEAIHGSAPDIAGRDVANPSGLILASVKMLAHVGQSETATRLHNAWLRTIEEGIHTPDVHSEGHSQRQVGTKTFTRAVADRLGQAPQALAPAYYQPGSCPMIAARPTEPARKELVGVDVFLHWRAGSPDQLGAALKGTETDRLKLNMITNRGVKVWPEGMPETFCTDHWRCRYLAPPTVGAVGHADVIELLQRIAGAGLDFIKTEHLCHFDGQPGYSLGQGQ